MLPPRTDAVGDQLVPQQPHHPELAFEWTGQYALQHGADVPYAAFYGVPDR